MPGVKAKDVHKLFKQAIISRRYLTEDLAGILWKKCEEACRKFNDDIPEQANPNEVNEYMQELGDTFKGLDIELKQRVDEVTGKRVWAMVNTTDGEIAQVATEYSAAELAYFKQVIDLIVMARSEVFSVSSLAAVREVSNMKVSMTKAQAETALQSFVANGWLYKSERARYALSSRSLIELEIFLRGAYEGEILECTQCTELCTLGVACENDEAGCEAVFHNHCYNILRRAAHPKCPACEADWARGNPVRQFGENSVPYGFDDFKKRRRKSEYDDDEGIVEEEIESPNASPAPLPPTQQNKKRGKLVKKAQMTQQDDEEEDELDDD